MPSFPLPPPAGGCPQSFFSYGSAEASALAISAQDVIDAAARIRGVPHRTPVLTSATFDEMSGLNLYFKCENLQKTGSFKVRGATNGIRQLSAEQKAKGVVTHSSGNHAQAVALAAREAGIPATIIMPENSPLVKVNAVKGYGATVVMCAPTQAAREAAADKAIAETGGFFIPPYNHPWTMAGQGTLAIELLEQVAEMGVPKLDAVVVPVGGGGMISGCSVYLSSQGVRTIGAEPLGADDAARSKAAYLAAGGAEQADGPSGVGVGSVVPPPCGQDEGGPRTVGDGLKTTLGDLV